MSLAGYSFQIKGNTYCLWITTPGFIAYLGRFFINYKSIKFTYTKLTTAAGYGG